MKFLSIINVVVFINYNLKKRFCFVVNFLQSDKVVLLVLSDSSKLTNDRKRKSISRTIYLVNLGVN